MKLSEDLRQKLIDMPTGSTISTSMGVIMKTTSKVSCSGCVFHLDSPTNLSCAWEIKFNSKWVWDAHSSIAEQYAKYVDARLEYYPCDNPERIVFKGVDDILAE